MEHRTWKYDRDWGTLVGSEECLIPPWFPSALLKDSLSLLTVPDSTFESWGDGASRGDGSWRRRWCLRSRSSRSLSEADSVGALSVSGLPSLLDLLGLQNHTILDNYSSNWGIQTEKRRRSRDFELPGFTVEPRRAALRFRATVFSTRH